MIDIDTLLTWGAAFKKLSAGEVIFHEGTESHFYYQLVNGRVKWVNINEDGREFLQTIIEPGESFGELPLFDDKPFAATAIADTDSIILRLEKSTFLKLLKENQSIHFAFTRLITERLRFKFFIIKEIAEHNPEHSISTLLQYLKKSGRNVCPECAQVKLTRQQIADMIGLRVETVIRTIKNLQAKGQLTINKGKVYC